MTLETELDILRRLLEKAKEQGFIPDEVVPAAANATT